MFPNFIDFLGHININRNIITIMFINITVMVFLKNQVGESSKQRSQAAWSTPIHHVKWWISRFRGAYRTQVAFEVELFVILAAFGLLYVTESSVLGAVRAVLVFRHFIIIIIITIIISFYYCCCYHYYHYHFCYIYYH